MYPVYCVNHVTGLYPSYILSLWERIEVRALTLALPKGEGITNDIGHITIGVKEIS
jgi:hypothetical protein